VAVPTSEPAHRTIERYLRDLIAEGAGRSEALPTEVELSQRFGVSRMTVRQAFNTLVAAGLVVRYRSKGTFAVVRILEDVGALAEDDFLARWAAQGYRIDMSVLAFAARPAPTAQAELFNVAPGAPLTYVERLRCADGLPLSWDVRWMPHEVGGCVSRSDLETTALFGLLRRRGFELGEMAFEISGRPALAVEARRLSCRRGSIVLHREVVCTRPDGRAIITGFSVYPADRVAYRARLSLTEAASAQT
jgi:GntR family transcriptional regulator